VNDERSESEGGSPSWRVVVKNELNKYNQAPDILALGNLDNGSNSGPFYANANNGLTNTNWNYLGRPIFHTYNPNHMLHFRTLETHLRRAYLWVSGIIYAKFLCASTAGRLLPNALEIGRILHLAKNEKENL
jgi:hypothetical protein